MPCPRAGRIRHGRGGAERERRRVPHHLERSPMCTTRSIEPPLVTSALARGRTLPTRGRPARTKSYSAATAPSARADAAATASPSAAMRRSKADGGEQEALTPV